jgi:hypothetical protein
MSGVAVAFGMGGGAKRLTVAAMTGGRKGESLPGWLKKRGKKLGGGSGGQPPAGRPAGECRIFFWEGGGRQSSGLVFACV